MTPQVSLSGEFRVEDIDSTEVLADVESSRDSHLEASMATDIPRLMPDVSAHINSSGTGTPSKGSDQSVEGAIANNVDEFFDRRGTSTPSEQQKTDGSGKEQDPFEAQCKEFSFQCPLARESVLESYPGASWLDPLHKTLTPLFFEICQMNMDVWKSERNGNDQWCFGIDWDGALERTCPIVQEFIDTRAELFTKEQEAVDNLLRSLVKHAEASREIRKHKFGCHSSQELQHETSVDSPGPIQKKLILTVKKTGKAYLKTSEPAMFLRLSRMIDLKKPNNVELNPFTKRRCIDYVLGRTGMIATNFIIQLTRSPPTEAGRGLIVGSTFFVRCRLQSGKASVPRKQVSRRGNAVT